MINRNTRLSISADSKGADAFVMCCGVFDEDAGNLETFCSVVDESEHVKHYLGKTSRIVCDASHHSGVHSVASRVPCFFLN